MYSNLLIIFAVLLLAVTGFIFLAVTLLAIWETFERRPPSLLRNFLSGRRLRFPLPHADCYEKCMAEFRWDTRKVPECSSACGCNDPATRIRRHGLGAR
jgi:hypothetical protein